jgi:hypothetical protein
MEGRGFGMIARSFRSVIWVATVGGAALCCYMVSLRVATERADLAKVDRQIIAAKREIRSLQTELGTRGRMSQLEDWNANVLALSAPAAGQFVKDDVTLARLERREPNIADRTAEVRMASAETGAAAAPPPAAAPAAEPPPRVVAAIAPPPAPPPHQAVRQASYTPAPKPAADAPRAKKPERQAKAPAKPERHAKAEAKPERHAKAEAKPAAGKKGVAKAAPEKKLAHAQPAHRPAGQESDAD